MKLNLTKRQANLVLCIGIIMLAVTTIYILFYTQPTPTVTQHQELPLDVNIETVALRTNTPYILVHSTTQSSQQSILSSEINGKVIKILAQQGMNVKKGAILAKIDDTRLRASLQIEKHDRDLNQEELQYLKTQLKNEMETAKNTQENLQLLAKDLARKKQLKRQNHISQGAVDEVEKSINQQENLALQHHQAINHTKTAINKLKINIYRTAEKIKITQKQHENTRIIAPFSGTIVRKFINLGEIVSPSTKLFEIADVNNIKTIVDIPARYVRDLYSEHRKNKKIVAVSYDRGKKILWQSKYLASYIKPESAGISIEFHTNSQHFFIGDLIPLYISLNPVEHSMKLPDSALYFRDNQAVIYKVVANRLRQVKVENYRYTIDSKQIISVIVQANIKDGDTIVITQSNEIYDGRLVEPISSELRLDELDDDNV